MSWRTTRTSGARCWPLAATSSPLGSWACRSGRRKSAVYALNGFCAALAGIVATLYTGSGNPSMGIGLELDAIAIVVIGGTLLTGGRGHMLGTLLGVLIFGTIQAAILFDGRLSSWWMRIVVGALLLLLFILLQRFFLRIRKK